MHTEEWRENGALKSWVTRPQEWERPVKYGLYDYSRVSWHDADLWHTEGACPLSQVLETIRQVQGEGTKVPPGTYETLEDLKKALPSLVLEDPAMEDLSGLLVLPFPQDLEDALGATFGPGPEDPEDGVS